MRSAALVIVLALGSAAFAMPPVPRKAPEFTIVEPTGKETLLTSMKGKVVLLGFVATWCEHCQQFSQMMTKIQRDLGPRGFQAMDVAFNQGVNPAMVNEFVHRFAINFPVGYASPDTVMSYLGISMAERYVYPEIVIVDRKGIIRAQSPSSGDPNLQDEKYLRNLLEALLKEGSTSKKY